MKKRVVLGFVGCFFVLLVLFLAVTTTALAQEEEKIDSSDVIRGVKAVFGDKGINNIEYLYGFDDSADYIYVVFQNSGYAVFFKDTMEMLEYAPTGSLPFDNLEGRKYYVGPQNCYVKRGGEYFNVFTKDALFLTKEEATDYSKQISKQFSSEKQTFKYEISPHIQKELETENGKLKRGRSIPEENDPIQADPPGTVGVTYIPHPEYFLAEPEFGENRHGTCGSVAVQLLLSYHNYYTDRRIIAPEHLNGGWKGVNGNGNIFDPSNYTTPEEDPNVCYDPCSLYSPTIGTKSGSYVYNSVVGERLFEVAPGGFYEHIIDEVEPSSFNCVCTCEIVTNIDESTGIATVKTIVLYPNGTHTLTTTNRAVNGGDELNKPIWNHSYGGSNKNQIISGLINLLNTRLGEGAFVVGSHTSLLPSVLPLNSSYVTGQIDAGNPVIIGMNEQLGGKDHGAVAYGYQEYTYPNNEGTYLGYVVHYGWHNKIGEQYDRIWVNQAWCFTCVTLELSHQAHSYSGTGNIINKFENNNGSEHLKQYQEVRCSVCGQRSIEELFTSTGSVITGATCALYGEILIPSEIDGVAITEIGASAFANQTRITRVDIPHTIEVIGNGSFNNCTGLSQISYSHPSGLAETLCALTTIGAKAFSGCTALAEISIPRQVETIGVAAFKGCTNLEAVSFFQSAWLLVPICAQLETIGEEAFFGCDALESITLPVNLTTIGDRAFKDCLGLSEVNLSMGESFLGGSLNLNPSLTTIGKEAFSGCLSLLSIALPSTVTKIGFLAFDPNTALDSDSEVIGANIDLVVLDGTASSYGSWQNKNFNIVEISTNPLKVKSGQLRGVVEIPSYLNEQVVTEIGASAFENQTQITRVDLSGSVIKIGSNAFTGCTNLEYITYLSLQDTTVNVPDHTTSYSNYYYTERFTGVELVAGWTYRLTFNYSQLSASTSLSNVFTNLGVGENCFALDITGATNFSNSTYGTQTIVFTPSAEQLQTSNKLWCRFIRTSTPQTVSVNISNVQVYIGITSIESNAFDGCPKLASPGLSYRLQSNNTYAVEGTESGGWDGLYYALSRTLFIPSVHNGLPVTTIDPWAFREDENMRWAFFQSGLTTIGNRAFQFCYNLESVNLSATSVTRFEAYTFDTCKLGSFYFPPNLTYIGEGAFIRAGEVGDMPNTVVTIGDYAFSYRTSSQDLRLSNGIYSIGDYAFAYCDSMILRGGSGLTIVGSYAFFNTRLPLNVTIPDTITNIGEYAFCNSGFDSGFALLDNSQITTIGAYAFCNCNLTRLTLSTTVITIGPNAFINNSSLTIYTEHNSKPTGWNSNWNSSNRPVVWGCTLSSDKSYVISFIKSTTNPTNSNATNGITNPIRKNYNFKGWYTTPDFSDTKYSTILEAPNGVLYAKWNEQSCVAEGTLITLADGSHVAVEDLTGAEELLVWNLLTGQFDSAPILFVDSDPYRTYEITHLFFSDGTEVKVIDEHAFWDIDLNKYVFIRNDAARYIGHWFSKQDEDPLGNMVCTTVQLVDVQVYEEQTTAWSPVTYGHLCFYVNDMLSMPGATEGLINIFDVDATTMTYDAVAFAADVAEYGLFTYEEFAALIPVPEVVFDAFNGQYLKISIGKGLITLVQIAFLIDRYSVFFA